MSIPDDAILPFVLLVIAAAGIGLRELIRAATGRSKPDEHEEAVMPSSGQMPMEFWRGEIRDIIRSELREAIRQLASEIRQLLQEERRK